MQIAKSIIIKSAFFNLGASQESRRSLRCFSFACTTVSPPHRSSSINLRTIYRSTCDIIETGNKRLRRIILVESSTISSTRICRRRIAYIAGRTKRIVSMIMLLYVLPKSRERCQMCQYQVSSSRIWLVRRRMYCSLRVCICKNHLSCDYTWD